jgi:uroporphyrinogen decarboxylase
MEEEMVETLTHRQRLQRTLRFQPVDRVPDLEFGAWIQTVDRWKQEGMDTYTVTEWGPIERYFGTDDQEYGPGLGINVGLLPGFDWQVVEERGQHRVIRDSDGALSEQLKPEYGASIPRYIRYAIESRADWEHLRDERLDPSRADRLPRYKDALIRRLQRADYPVTLWLGSLYGWIRNWMGVENLSLALYDDRPLVEEMMEHLTRLTLSVLEQLAGSGMRVDLGTWWEDMCYNHGPLISTRMFRELMVPRYKRTTDFMREAFGTEFHMLDCDGNIHQLVPLWLEGGINVMFPVEKAHTDPYRIAQAFGHRTPMRGAVDKRALIAGPEAIDAEFERLRPLFERGGLIPHTDHLVPPDVSLENYIYYRRKKCELIGKTWREPGIRHWPGHVTNWRLLGPFENRGNRGFRTPCAPELPNADYEACCGKGGRLLEWQRYDGRAPSGYVDLAAAVSREPWSVAYAACSLYSPSEREGWLELGSDDGIRVWLNGAEIWCQDAYRVAAPKQDLLPVHLRQGWNDVLLKVSQAEGEWGFYFRLTDDSGDCWPDLAVRI